VTGFSKIQSRELRKLLRRLPEVASTKGCERFLLRYIGFEAVARKVWHYYRCRKKSQSESKSGIPLPELIKSISHFQIEVSDDVIHQLLDSKLTKRGSKSARNLRNGIVHAWKKDDCDEAKKRLEEFCHNFDVVHNQVSTVIEARNHG